MVRPRLAGWEREPLVPEAMMVKFPVLALGAAEKRTGALEPAAMLKGLAGLEMTPEGKPVNVTWTVPVKPLSGSMDKLTGGPVAACWTATEFAENAIEKSGEGEGGGGGGGDC
jgi:hypothetical protein